MRWLGTSTEERPTYSAVFKRVGLSLTSIGLAVLALAWTMPADAFGLVASSDKPFETDHAVPLVAESSTDASVTLGLVVHESGAERPTLNLRGSRADPGNSGPFDVSTRVSQVPCAGEYLFTAAQENTLNGNNETYAALIRLFDPEAHPAGARCGISPPRLPGHLEVSLSVLESKIFSLKGDRENGGPFNGTLAFDMFPQCGRDYRLGTELGLAGWTRKVEFNVRVLEFKVTFQGRALPAQRC